MMADQQDYETLLPKFKALDKKSLRKQDMPIDQAVKEGEVMAAAARIDGARLDEVGCSKEKVDELEASVSALRYAQAVHTVALGDVKDAAREWKEEEPAGYELRDDLLAAMSYGLRNVPDALKSIRQIREGNGGADMIQDLLALSQLGKRYEPELQKIKFDSGRLDLAAQKADSLGRAFAGAFIERKSSETKEMRDRAFTYMRLVMADVLAAAEYAFRKDAGRLEFYHSAYRRQAGTSNNKSNEPEMQTVETAAAAAK
jgi:hypothetical protein